MIISTKAVVLSKLKYKDHDLIVNCYTASKGLVSFLVKGAFSSKKIKLKPAYFQSLSMVQIEIDYKYNRNLHYIKNIRLLHAYRSLQTDILKSTVVIFLSEVLGMILKEEESNQALFTYIETALLWFDTVDQSSLFHHHFLMGLTKYTGFFPESSSIHFPYFNLEAGQYQTKNTSHYCISGSKLILFNSVLGTKFDTIEKNKINSSERRELLDLILMYFKLHLQGFKPPKSLAVLNQVFN